MRITISLTNYQSNFVLRAIRTILEDGSGSYDRLAQKAADAIKRQLAGSYTTTERENIYRSAIALTKDSSQ